MDAPPLPTLAYQVPDDLAAPPGWTGITAHTLTDAGWPAAARTRLTLYLLQVGGMMAIVVAAFSLAFGLPGLPEVAFLSVFYLMLIVVRSFLVVKKARRDWLAYRLILADQGLHRTLAGHPPLTIPFDRIRRAHRTRHWLQVYSRQRLHTLRIPAALEGFDVVAARIETHVPLVTLRHPRWRAVGFFLLVLLLGMLPLGVFAIGMFSSRLSLELPSLAFLIAMFAWSTWVIWRSPNIKRSNRFLILFHFAWAALLTAKIVLTHF